MSMSPEMQEALKIAFNDRDVHKVPYETALDNPFRKAKPEVLKCLPDALAFAYHGTPLPGSEPVSVPPRDEPVCKFEMIARAAIARGESRVLPIEVGGKNPAIKWAGSDIDVMNASEWAQRADPWVRDLAQRFPDLNACVVAKPEENVFIDCDTYREFVAGYEAFAAQPFPKTYTTSARDNRVQIHFRQSDATRALGNVPQFAADGIDLSVRQRNMYVLAEGSQHPTGSTYQRVVDAAIIPMPDKMVEYIRDLKARVVKAAKESGATDETPRNERGLVPHGHIHPWLVSQAGKLRNQKLTADEIEEILLRRAGEECEPPIDEVKVRQVARSVGEYAPSEDKSLLFTQKAEQAAPVADDAPDVVVENGITYAIIPHGQGFRRVAIDTSKAAARPVFPTWVMNDTSIYENLVKPAVETSSKYAEFIFVPAMQMMMNYLSGKVNIELHPTNMNMFVGLVSPYGKFFKSTSCKLAHDYFHVMGLCTTSSPHVVDSGSKVVIEQVGSPEGMGIEMKRMNAKHAIMFNDELGKLVSKVGIDNSGFSSDLLSWHGSHYFGNKTKNAKTNFTFPDGSYTFGWLWCTTDRNFNHYWPKLAGISSGIQDRMFFVISPEQPRESKLYRDPSLAGALKTKELIDRGVNQRTFQFEDIEMFETRSKGLDPRSLDLMLKLSLFFAIDLGLSIVDDDCVERARALVDYRNGAAAFLEPIEAENAEGRLMQEIRREIRQHGGIMAYRDLCRNLNADRAGRIWDIAYRLLKNAGTQAIIEFYEGRTKGKRKTHMVAIKIDEEDLPE